MLASPLVGLYAAGFSIGAAIVSPFMLRLSSILAAAFGYGDYVQTQAAHIAWRRAHSGRASMLPVDGAPQAGRMTPFSGEELGPLKGFKFPLRIFNAGYSFGFLIGTIVFGAFVALFAPFAGFGVALLDVYVSLARPFLRLGGSLFTDMIGLTPLLAQRTALWHEEMGTRPGQTAADTTVPVANAARIADSAAAPLMPTVAPSYAVHGVAQGVAWMPLQPSAPPAMPGAAAAYGAPMYPPVATWAQQYNVPRRGPGEDPGA